MFCPAAESSTGNSCCFFFFGAGGGCFKKQPLTSRATLEVGGAEGENLCGFSEVEGKRRSESRSQTSAAVFATLKLNLKSQPRRGRGGVCVAWCPGQLFIPAFIVLRSFINASGISSELRAHTNANRASHLIAFNRNQEFIASSLLHYG